MSIFDFRGSVVLHFEFWVMYALPGWSSQEASLNIQCLRAFSIASQWVVWFKKIEIWVLPYYCRVDPRPPKSSSSFPDRPPLGAGGAPRGADPGVPQNFTLLPLKSAHVNRLTSNVVSGWGAWRACPYKIWPQSDFNYRTYDRKSEKLTNLSTGFFPVFAL